MASSLENATGHRLMSTGESNHQKQILELLRRLQLQGVVSWFERSNSGGGRAQSGRWIPFYRLFLPRHGVRTTGKADVTGMLVGGRFFAIEIKDKPSDHPSPEQQDYLDCVREGGGIALVARSREEVEEWLTAGVVKGRM